MVKLTKSQPIGINTNLEGVSSMVCKAEATLREVEKRLGEKMKMHHELVLRFVWMHKVVAITLSQHAALHSNSSQAHPQMVQACYHHEQAQIYEGKYSKLKTKFDMVSVHRYLGVCNHGNDGS